MAKSKDLRRRAGGGASSNAPSSSSTNASSSPAAKTKPGTSPGSAAAAAGTKAKPPPPPVQPIGLLSSNPLVYLIALVPLAFSLYLRTTVGGVDQSAALSTSIIFFYGYINFGQHMVALQTAASEKQVKMLRASGVSLAFGLALAVVSVTVSVRYGFALATSMAVFEGALLNGCTVCYVVLAIWWGLYE
ncbi:hypothetical protein DFJ73DRAFT_868114 [Zopfochytrium polystomum]|nr:hypothetical protein DFJ73DRAFT_868114 [Zopfochytrium polystomum]